MFKATDVYIYDKGGLCASVRRAVCAALPTARGSVCGIKPGPLFAATQSVPLPGWSLYRVGDGGGGGELFTGDGVAQLVERWPRDPMNSMTRGSKPVKSTRTISESFSESKCCADSLSECPTPVCTRMHKNVCTLNIL